MGLLSILFTAVNAILPIVLLIILGFILRKFNFFNDDFLKTGNKLVFKIGLTCTLFVNVYSIESFSHIRWDMIAYSMGMLLLMFLLGLVCALLTTREPKRRGVIWQSAFCSNFAIIGLALAQVLGGEEAIANTAVVSAFIVPTVNIMSVIALSALRGAHGEKPDVKAIVMNIAKNPLIMGVLVGLACLGIRSLQTAIFGRVIFSLSVHTKFLYTALNYIKSMTTPLALIILGGQFQFQAVKSLRREILIGTLCRIVISPLIAIGAAVVLTKMGITSFDATHYPAFIALFAAPVAVSSAIMAGQMDNDEQLATQLVVWTCMFSVLTIFVIVCILMALGLLVI